MFQELETAMPQAPTDLRPAGAGPLRGLSADQAGEGLYRRRARHRVGIAQVLATRGLMYDRRLRLWHDVACRAVNEEGRTARERSVLAVLAEGVPARANGRRPGSARAR